MQRQERGAAGVGVYPSKASAFESAQLGVPTLAELVKTRQHEAIKSLPPVNMKSKALLSALLLFSWAHSFAAPADPTKAAESCEVAVGDTIKEMRGKDVQDIQFTKEKRVLTPTTGDETDVKGAGRYKLGSSGPRPFTFGCAYNPVTNATSGIVFRDAGPLRSEADQKPWDPDLSKVSPEACEIAVVADLKKKHPRVGRIVLGSDSRRLQPASDGRSSLEGMGAVERAPGMNAISFKYACEFEPKSGRIVAVRTAE